jgi:hypothetical protein
MTRFSRICFLLSLLCFLCFAAGCTTTWITEASNIIALLLPSAGGILGILGALGTAVPPNTLAEFTKWDTQAQTGLTLIGQLINQYNAAEATAKPGILTEIETATAQITNSLGQILPLIKVSDPATQEKVTAVVQLFQSELTALLNLIPVIKGESGDVPAFSAHEAHARLAAVMTAKTFKHNWNKAVDELGVVSPPINPTSQFKL